MCICIRFRKKKHSEMKVANKSSSKCYWLDPWLKGCESGLQGLIGQVRGWGFRSTVHGVRSKVWAGGPGPWWTHPNHDKWKRDVGPWLVCLVMLMWGRLVLVAWMDSICWVIEVRTFHSKNQITGWNLLGWLFY